MSDRTYFLVEPGGAVMRVIEDALGMAAQFNAALAALEQEFGGKCWFTNDCWCVRLAGIAFPGDLPAGWRSSQRGYAVPDKRIKAGRILEERFKSLPEGVSAARFSSMLKQASGASYDYHHEDARWQFTVFEKHGDVYVLSVPTACKANPPGCIELKMSEYWQIVEAGQMQSALARARAEHSPPADPELPQGSAYKKGNSDG